MGIYLEFPRTTLQTKPIESGNIVFFVFYLVLNIMVKYSSSRRCSLGSAVLKKKPNRLVNQLILASQAEIDFNTILIIHSLSKSNLWNIFYLSSIMAKQFLLDHHYLSARKDEFDHNKPCAATEFSENKCAKSASYCCRWWSWTTFIRNSCQW